jgi:hypothetical protein
VFGYTDSYYCQVLYYRCVCVCVCLCGYTNSYCRQVLCHWCRRLVTLTLISCKCCVIGLCVCVCLVTLTQFFQVLYQWCVFRVTLTLITARHCITGVCLCVCVCSHFCLVLCHWCVYSIFMLRSLKNKLKITKKRRVYFV